MHTSPYTPAGTDEITAPWNKPDDTRTAYDCSVCGMVGYETFRGSDLFEDADGNLLNGSQRTVKGWACSKKCSSQAMFEASSDAEKNSLKRLEIALREIEEHAPAFPDLVKSLTAAAEDVRDAIGFYEQPEWIAENKSRESVLDEAIRKASSDLYIAPSSGLRARITCEIEAEDGEFRLSSEYSAGAHSSILASIGNVILRLQESINR